MLRTKPVGRILQRIRQIFRKQVYSNLSASPNILNILCYEFLDRAVLDHFFQYGPNCCGYRFVKIKIIEIVHHILPKAVKCVLKVSEIFIHGLLIGSPLRN